MRVPINQDSDIQINEKGITVNGKMIVMYDELGSAVFPIGVVSKRPEDGDVVTIIDNRLGIEFKAEIERYSHGKLTIKSIERD